MNTLDLLNEVDLTLSNERNWTKHAIAKDKYGKTVNPRSPNADCFCLQGAIAKVCSSETEQIQVNYAFFKVLSAHYSSLASFNDSFRIEFGDIKELISNAIKRERGKEYYDNFKSFDRNG